jgi:hypothetical protein
MVKYLIHEGLLAFVLLLTTPIPGDHAPVAVYNWTSSVAETYSPKAYSIKDKDTLHI